MTHGLTAFEAAHAQSILDAQPVLEPIPAAFVPHIRIGIVVRKPPAVISALLKCLDAQVLRDKTDRSYHFITDFAPQDPGAAQTIELLQAFGTTHQSLMETGGNVGGDFSDVGPSHSWTPQAWHRVGGLKNRIFQQALNDKVSHIWLLDADVMCDTTTLQSLKDVNSPIVAAVYWTQWMKQKAGDRQIIHAAPQVWVRHPYLLSGNGYTEASFRAALIERKLVKVGGLGACTLFTREAIEKGVSFQPVPEGLPPGPMGDGEDRHLCERARRLHLPLLADAWPDIWHAYHADEYPQLEEWVTRLTTPHPTKPSRGDLVSIRIEPLEPFPHPSQPNTIQYFGPHFSRGRLGSGQWMPEIQETVAGMAVGDRRIVTLHYPVHHEYPTLRSQQRLVAITLCDAKPFRYAPVLEREVLAGAASGSWADTTTLTAQAIDDFHAEPA